MSHTGFPLALKVVTLNDLERRMTVILRYFTEFGSFWAFLGHQLHQSG